MKLFLLFVFAVAILGSLIAWMLRSGKEPVSCFSPENFDKTIDYTRWKDRTSKIGKVLVNDYRVKVSPENEILFKDDKNDYTIFKVTRDKGIVLLPIKQSKSLARKANEAYCELLKRAEFHPVNPQK